MSVSVRIRAIVMAVALSPLCVLAEVADAADDEDPQQLDRVVVTANRAGEDPALTPASITVRDMANLRLRGLDEPGDEFAGVPGIFFRRENEEHASVNIRGVTGSHGNDTFLVLVDGIPMVNADEEVAFTEVPHAAVDRIEIVRGPMSALYGRGAISGVVNYRLQEPDENMTRLAASIGNDGFRRIEGVLERRFSSAGLLASASHDRDDGWRVNSAREVSNLFVRYRQDIDIGKRLSLYINHLDRDTEVSNPIPTLANGASVDVVGGRASFLGYGAPRAQVRSTLAALRWEQRLGERIDWTTTLAARRHDSRSRLNFYDVSGFDPQAGILAINGFYSPNHNRTDSLESQLAWHGDRHQAVVGVSHERHDIDERDYWTGQNGFTPECGYAFYLVQVDYRTGQVINADHPCFVHDNLQSADTARSVFHGIYAQDRIALSERWHLTIGARYDVFRRTVDFRPLGPFAVGGRLRGDQSAISPKAALAWHHRQGQTYLSYGRGFNSNFGPLYEWDRQYYARKEAPTTIDSLELGWKGQFLDGRLRLEAGVFRLLQKNRRVVVSNPDPTGPSTLVTTGQRYRSQGLEASLIWQPSAVTRFGLDYTWLDPEWDEYAIDTDTGPRDLSGFKPVGIPAHMLSLELAHRISSTFGLRANYQWYADYYVNQVNTVKIGGFDLLNLHATITPPSLPQISIDLSLTNALDRDYGWYFGNEFDAVSHSPGTPRQLRATLRWEF